MSSMDFLQIVFLLLYVGSFINMLNVGKPRKRANHIHNSECLGDILYVGFDPYPCKFNIAHMLENDEKNPIISLMMTDDTIIPDGRMAEEWLASKSYVPTIDELKEAERWSI